MSRVDGWGLVYYVQAGTDGPIKIGFTRRAITSRLAQIQPSSPVPLRLLLTRAGTLANERAEHERFAAIRVRGEWFQPSPELLNHIRAGRNDPWLAPDKLRQDVWRLDWLEYWPMRGCRPGPQIASAVVPDAHRLARDEQPAAEVA